MKRSVGARVVALLALSGAMGCSSDSTTGGSTGGSLIAIAAVGIQGSFSNPTLTRAQLLWDGNVIDDESFSPAVSNLSLGGSVQTSSGHHTLTIHVVSQTTTSATYDVSGEIQSTSLRSTASQEITLADHVGSFNVGTNYSYTVTLN